MLKTRRFEFGTPGLDRQLIWLMGPTACGDVSLPRRMTISRDVQAWR